MAAMVVAVAKASSAPSSAMARPLGASLLGRTSRVDELSPGDGLNRVAA